MFLQYFMLGTWIVPLGTYMSKGLRFDHVIGIAYGSQGIATIISTMVVGVIADRLFAAQKVLATLFLLSALMLIALAFETRSVGMFLILTFVHFLFFVPTIPVANAICFRWLPQPVTQFPRIRVMGTVGWIAGGLLVGTITGAGDSRLPLLIAGSIGILLAAYALTLPKTPPCNGTRPSGLASLIGWDVVRSVQVRSFWILIVMTFLITLPMAFYYAYCNNFLRETGATLVIVGWHFEASAIQSLGQVSELVFLLILPLFLRAFGIKGVLVAGLGSWILRCGLFAAASGDGKSVLWMLLAGVLLHGMAQDFVQVAGQIYVDSIFDADAKSRAQAFLITVLMGAGALVGSVAANIVYVLNTRSTTEHDWMIIWMLPAIFAALVLLWFGFTFRERANGPTAKGIL